MRKGAAARLEPAHALLVVVLGRERAAAAATMAGDFLALLEVLLGLDLVPVPGHGARELLEAVVRLGLLESLLLNTDDISQKCIFSYFRRSQITKRNFCNLRPALFEDPEKKCTDLFLNVINLQLC